MTRIGGFFASIVRICTGEVWRTQQEPRAVRLRIEIERVMHLAGRMALREIELGEVEIVGFDIGALGDRKAHVGEDGGELVHHPG